MTGNHQADAGPFGENRAPGTARQIDRSGRSGSRALPPARPAHPPLPAHDDGDPETKLFVPAVPANPPATSTTSTPPAVASPPDESVRRAAYLASLEVVAPAEVLPARWGWRGRVRRASGGLVKPTPSPAEMANRHAVTTIRQATWTRAVNIIVANPKGGTGKTPTALILAGILGHYRGGYVVAWEAAESMGSLSRRAEGEPLRGLSELLSKIEDIHSAGNLGGYTAPQTSHVDVIGSIARRPVLSAHDIVAVRRVIDAYYRITVTDTGNNPGHEAFAAALATADAAVLPCLVSIDALAGVEEALAVMADDPALSAGLRTRVVVVLGHDGGPEDAEIASALRRRLEQLDVAAVVEVPFDPAIRLGGEITLSSLSEASNRAWTAVGAAVVQTLRTAPTSVDLVARFEQQL
jgi:MinD-like ATPase involved in chromosome partitioning or flagellar assembly